MSSPLPRELRVSRVPQRQISWLHLFYFLHSVISITIFFFIFFDYLLDLQVIGIGVSIPHSSPQFSGNFYNQFTTIEGQRWELKAFLQQSPAVDKGRNGQFCENITDLVASRGIRAVKRFTTFCSQRRINPRNWAIIKLSTYSIRS